MLPSDTHPRRSALELKVKNARMTIAMQTKSVIRDKILDEELVRGKFQRLLMRVGRQLVIGWVFM